MNISMITKMTKLLIFFKKNESTINNDLTSGLFNDLKNSMSDHEIIKKNNLNDLYIYFPLEVIYNIFENKDDDEISRYIDFWKEYIDNNINKELMISIFKIRKYSEYKIENLNYNEVLELVKLAYENFESANENDKEFYKKYIQNAAISTLNTLLSIKNIDINLIDKLNNIIEKL